MMLVLYTRRGCHLCEAAADMLAIYGPLGGVEPVDIDADPVLQSRYGLRVPVLTADGVIVMEGRFDEVELVRLLGQNSR
jgi:predicted thioredoxin/glutaredoxin